ncbi:MAG: hypothetical protein QXJ59_00370 [Thermofilaceae archaeon]
MEEWELKIEWPPSGGEEETLEEIEGPEIGKVKVVEEGWIPGFPPAARIVLRDDKGEVVLATALLLLKEYAIETYYEETAHYDRQLNIKDEKSVLDWVVTNALWIRALAEGEVTLYLHNLALPGLEEELRKRGIVVEKQ